MVELDWVESTTRFGFSRVSEIGGCLMVQFHSCCLESVHLNVQQIRSTDRCPFSDSGSSHSKYSASLWSNLAQSEESSSITDKKRWTDHGQPL